MAHTYFINSLVSLKESTRVQLVTCLSRHCGQQAVPLTQGSTRLLYTLFKAPSEKGVVD